MRHPWKFSSSEALGRLLAGLLAISCVLNPIALSNAWAVEDSPPSGQSPNLSNDPTAGLPDAPPPPKPSCETSLIDPSTAELSQLKDEKLTAQACVSAGACARGEGVQSPAFKLFKFTRGLVIQSGIEIWESVKAIRGRELRKRPAALMDFFKNMAIIWPGQVVGWLKEQAKNGITPTLGNAPYPIFAHTAFMVWTQSDRGAGQTPETDPPTAAKPPKKLWTWVDRALQRTPQPAGTWARGLLESTLPALGLLQDAYRGKNGFWKENGKRLVGFLSIIPLEILSLTTMESLKAMPGLIRTGRMPENFMGTLENRAVFAVLFGVYLSLKWSLFSKVFDLRVLPAFRQWASSGWKPRWEAAKQQSGMRFKDGQVFDELKLGRLLTVDLYRGLTSRPFPSQIEGCRLVASKAGGEDPDGKGWSEYCARVGAYAQFAKSGEFVKLLRENPAAWLKHIAGFPIEMTYRYGNSFIDGALVFWMLNSAIPMLLGH